MARKIGSRSPALPSARPSVWTGASAHCSECVIRLLGLGGQDQDVVTGQPHLIGLGDRRHLLDDILVRCAQPETDLAQGAKMIAAGDQDHRPAGQGQPAADGPADRAGADDDVAGHLDTVT